MPHLWSLLWLLWMPVTSPRPHNHSYWHPKQIDTVQSPEISEENLCITTDPNDTTTTSCYCHYQYYYYHHMIMKLFSKFLPLCNLHGPAIIYHWLDSKGITSFTILSPNQLHWVTKRSRGTHQVEMTTKCGGCLLLWCHLTGAVVCKVHIDPSKNHDTV